MRFQAVSVEEAEAARRAREDDVRFLIASIITLRREAQLDSEYLLSANLISGVVSSRD